MWLQVDPGGALVHGTGGDAERQGIALRDLGGAVHHCSLRVTGGRGSIVNIGLADEFW